MALLYMKQQRQKCSRAWCVSRVSTRDCDPRCIQPSVHIIGCVRWVVYHKESVIYSCLSLGTIELKLCVLETFRSRIHPNVCVYLSVVIISSRLVINRVCLPILLALHRWCFLKTQRDSNTQHDTQSLANSTCLSETALTLHALN